MSVIQEQTYSQVEKKALIDSTFDGLDPPTEKISTIVVTNFPTLGKLAAMRFIEWVQQNPNGVISLPTGKTPEHFITWVNHILSSWEQDSVRAELAESGIDPELRPAMRGLHFVQIDEFYPINSAQQNSFFSYVNRFYIDGFGLDPDKALLIDSSGIGLEADQTIDTVWPDGEVDLSLRFRAATSALEQTQQQVLQRLDQWCQEYENRIRSLGGIGFFLGGIGPDGHIGFNVRGSDHRSITRLSPVNYETQAAAAGDLGGIEVSRKRLVITIGLGTICFNPNAVALVMAAGEAKAGIVAAAVQEQAHINFPSTALHSLPRARFYITMGAAKQLYHRQLQLLTDTVVPNAEQVDKILIDLATKQNKRLVDLTPADLASDPFAAQILAKCSSTASQLASDVRDRIIAKLERGANTLHSTRFLHTEPHHDDLMLGYLPYIIRHIRDPGNTHFFVCLTGGFTAVTNQFIVDNVKRLRHFMVRPECCQLLAEGYFAPDNLIGRNRDIWQYLDGIAAKDKEMCDEGVARRFLRNLIELYGDLDLEAIKAQCMVLESYFASQFAGQKDVADIQLLKGMCREWEAECLWGYLGWNCTNVKHLRLAFYTGDIFTQEPTVEGDVLPILNLIDEVQPDVIGVALDPEASGPDTHYKVLQAITEALRRHQQGNGRSDLKIWGYRNVWFRFHPSEANIFVPVSLNSLSTMHSAFMNTFISQKDASFPSYEHNGPFSELAQRLQVEQYQKIKICLGREWFQEHTSPLIRATRGLVYLNEMDLDAFYQLSRELKQAAEDQ